jgi:hypothetical protein
MQRIHSFFPNLTKIAYLVVVTALLYLALADRVYDDPFITYRYANNIRNGVGFVYNPGEQILSTTTPLFAIILAVGGSFWSNLPHLANFIGSFCVAIGGLCLWELGKVWETPWVGWTGLLLYPAFPLLLSTLGSETPLFLALILGVFLFYARQQYGLAFLLLVLSILTRSDGVLVALILGMHYVWVNRSQLQESAFWRNQPWIWIGIALGLLVAWHGFAWLYFGSPLPVTLAAKQAQGRMAISQGFAPGFLRVVGWYSGGWQYWIELVLAGIGLILGIIKKQHWLLILSWTVLYFLAYTVLGVTQYFWYYAPLVPGWTVAVGMGFLFLGGLPISGEESKFLSWARIFQSLLIGLLAVMFLAQLIQVNRMRSTNDQRYPIYRAVGEWLRENTPADASVGALEIGMIGYFSQRPMVDFAGLLQPDVADQMQSDTTYDDTAIWATLAYQPQYLAVISGVHPQLEAEVVAKYCQLVKRFVGSEYGYSNMQIFLCQYNQ